MKHQDGQSDAQAEFSHHRLFCKAAVDLDDVHDLVEQLVSGPQRESRYPRRFLCHQGYLIYRKKEMQDGQQE